MSEGAHYRTSAAPAALESTCLLCGTDGDAEKSCVSCAVALPRITCACGTISGVASTRCPRCSADLTEGPQAYACPRCTSPLTAVGVDASASVHVCLGCRGLFVPARAWHVLMGREDLVASLAQHLPATGEPTPTDPRLFDCRQCGAQMDRMRFAATSTVVIDVCPHQHGVWLDAGELTATTAYARHRRAIGAEAAIAEAEARDRIRPDLDPARLQHQLAHQLALAARERGTMTTPGAATDAWKRSPRVFIALAFVVLYFVYSCTFGAGHKHEEPTQDAHGKSVRDLR
jgi:Zn-finger nucleic acid-binding protein